MIPNFENVINEDYLFRDFKMIDTNFVNFKKKVNEFIDNFYKKHISEIKDILSRYSLLVKDKTRLVSNQDTLDKLQEQLRKKIEFIRDEVLEDDRTLGAISKYFSTFVEVLDDVYSEMMEIEDAIIDLKSDDMTEDEVGTKVQQDSDKMFRLCTKLDKDLKRISDDI